MVHITHATTHTYVVRHDQIREAIQAFGLRRLERRPVHRLHPREMVRFERATDDDEDDDDQTDLAEVRWGVKGKMESWRSQSYYSIPCLCTLSRYSIFLFLSYTLSSFAVGGRRRRAALVCAVACLSSSTGRRGRGG